MIRQQPDGIRKEAEEQTHEKMGNLFAGRQKNRAAYRPENKTAEASIRAVLIALTTGGPHRLKLAVFVA